MKYLNGVIKELEIPGERTLIIKTTAESEGHDLDTNFTEIIGTYSKYITCLCFDYSGINQVEIIPFFEKVHKAGLKAALFTSLQEFSQVNKKLTDILDYIKFEDKLYKKDYSPFGDVEDWINL